MRASCDQFLGFPRCALIAVYLVLELLPTSAHAAGPAASAQGGVGVVMVQTKDGVVVVHVMRKSPSDVAGIKEGDIIEFIEPAQADAAHPMTELEKFAASTVGKLADATSRLSGAVGEQLKVVVIHDKESINVTVARAPLLDIWRNAADAGDAIAMHTLGGLYATGERVARDPVEAMRWYRKAADAGLPDSMRELGVLYTRQNVPDYKNAMVWFAKAAAAGDPGSMYNLGLIYANGWGVREDHRLAHRWYYAAAQGGSPEAMLNLGLTYIDGDGTKMNKELGVQWVRKSASSGYELAQRNLQMMMLGDLLTAIGNASDGTASAHDDETETWARRNGALRAKWGAGLTTDDEDRELGLDHKPGYERQP